MAKSAAVKEKAAQHEIERIEQAQATKQLSRVKGLPEQYVNAPWSGSVTGCIIYMGEYEERGSVDRLKNHYWNVYGEYLRIMSDAAKAVDSPENFGGGSGAANYEEDSQGYIDWCNRVELKRIRLRKALLHLNKMRGDVVNIWDVLRIFDSKEDQQGQWKKNAHKLRQIRSVLDCVDKFIKADN